jgi:hypothetical protein
LLPGVESRALRSPSPDHPGAARQEQRELELRRLILSSADYAFG